MKLTNFNEDLAKAFGLLGEKITDVMVDELVSDNKIATGNLIQSIRSRVEETQEGPATVIEFAQYGVYVDAGRRPGDKMPPVQAIESWISQRRIKTGTFTQTQLAWAIAKSIAKKGIKASPFIDNSIEYAINNFSDELAEAGAKGGMEDFVQHLQKTFPDSKVTQS
jgi:hypothetical protein